MDLKIIIAVLAVLAGIGFIISGTDFTASVFDSNSCEFQKVNISGQLYDSKAELQEDVLSNGGQTAWNNIEQNVAGWKTRNGALHFKPANCDRVNN